MDQVIFAGRLFCFCGEALERRSKVFDGLLLFGLRLRSLGLVSNLGGGCGLPGSVLAWNGEGWP